MRRHSSIVVVAGVLVLMSTRLHANGHGGHSRAGHAGGHAGHSGGTAMGATTVGSSPISVGNIAGGHVHVGGFQHAGSHAGSVGTQAPAGGFAPASGFGAGISASIQNVQSQVGAASGFGQSTGGLDRFNSPPTSFGTNFGHRHNPLDVSPMQGAMNISGGTPGPAVQVTPTTTSGATPVLPAVQSHHHSTNSPTVIGPGQASSLDAQAGHSHQRFASAGQFGQKPAHLTGSTYEPSFRQHAGLYHGHWQHSAWQNTHWQNSATSPPGHHVRHENGSLQNLLSQHGHHGSHQGTGGGGDHHRQHGQHPSDRHHHNGQGSNGNGVGSTYITISGGNDGDAPYFWGTGGWGLGALIYGSGYLDYSNPYATSPFVYAGTGYSYAQPIPVAYNNSSESLSYSMAPLVTQTTQATVTGGLDRDDDALSLAVTAFRENDYDTALNITSNAITLHPNDAVLHEFRGLVLFAMGDYQKSAATIHSVLAIGPGWDWPTVSGIYADVSLYTVQLRALEQSVRQNPQNGAARFLLAYHYLTAGHSTAAERQLSKVVELQPNDQVAAGLLKMLAAPQPESLSEGTQVDRNAQLREISSDRSQLSAREPTEVPLADLPSPQRVPEPVAVDPAALQGTWTAARGDDSRFELKILDGDTFKWTYTPRAGAPQSFHGKYTLTGHIIALEREGGGSLVAEITGQQESRFNLKLVGSPDEDPGLDFQR